MANFHQPPIEPISAYIVNLFHGYKPPRNDTTGLYVCLNCDHYIPSANKTDWLQHTHDVHKGEFDKLEEI
ncbi:unnamed protein product [Rotaria sordida]|uniref:Uncharacterized protein n=1 Tax=Rotaria sordida TaxID=392033 RepID=A0A815FQY3_9BILA|nr:unnamed protein product [Rotaria sordida]CAF1329916.1 unnamed protein product [Rotaria sordida]CAF1590997.1 unnamed protein product [Rotaria sordida]CAF3652682.1 unnamed protein product [Rotaria sordida]